MRQSVIRFLCLTSPLLALGACQDGAGADAPSETATQAPAAVAASWPASLNVFGDGFPKPSDPCRRIGESEATVNFLDDSAALVGCLSPEDAAALGGKVVATVNGVTLVSVPADAAAAGDGDGQGDAKVAGTKYHATAQIRCSGYKGAAAGMCDAGVVRDAETGPYIEVKLPDGVVRIIFFEKSGKFLSFSTAQADGTAAMDISSKREGDTTIAMLGTERYEIPDVFVMGD